MGPIRGGRMNMEAFWSKPSVKVEIKTTWEVVSTCEVLWSARLNTSKVTENRLEDHSSQWEATKRSVGLSSARVVDATETGINDGERRLFDIPSASTSVYESGRQRSKRWSTSQHLATVKVVWRQKSTTKLWARSAACIRSLAKLSLATFSVTEPANWL